MTYSIDFRKRILEIKKKRNLTFQTTSDLFGVSIRTLFNWSNRVEPKTKRNKPATKIDMEKLTEGVKQRPDDYQYERAERFGVSQWGIGSALKRLKITNKKNSKSSQG